MKAKNETSAPANRDGKAYARAGVDIDLADSLKGGLKERLQTSSRPEVLGKIGGFGGLFDLSGMNYREPVLVSSVDGVGTKLRLAFSSGRHRGIGADLVNHCLNDIAVLGAEPLFFLDYLGVGKLEPAVFDELLAGIGEACQAARCALIGGETAQMPGFYRPGEYDLAGAIVGIVEKSRILSGEAIRPGDTVIGLASSGLHTNGYSLATEILFNRLQLDPAAPLSGAEGTLMDALLAPHLDYSILLSALLTEHNRGETFGARTANAIFGAAHITGGGLLKNIPRILPDGCGVEIDTASWKKPPVFKLLAQRGDVAFEELYEVFNMGVGMTLLADSGAVSAICETCSRAGVSARPIGRVVEGTGEVRLRA